MNKPKYQLPPQQLIITLTGPSGVGKDTLMKEIRAIDNNINFLVSATTRPPRGGEIHGEHYYFFTDEDFEKGIEKGDFLEYNGSYLGRRYGTLFSEVKRHMAEGMDVISDINSTGIEFMQKKVPDNLLSILVLPPSLGELIERMQERRKLTLEDPNQLAKRLERITLDMQHIDEAGYVFQSGDLVGSTKEDYDYIVVNNDLAEATSAIVNIIKAERTKRQERCA